MTPSNGHERVSSEPKRAAHEQASGSGRARRSRLSSGALPPLAVLPTLCTLGNLVAGFAAVYYASRGDGFDGPWGWSNFTFAGALIFLGLFLDAIDGSIARLTHSFSDLGAQLDSFADLVTFGVAPAYMTLLLVGNYFRDQGVMIIGPETDHMLGRVVWAVAAVYLCCAALRLARFNVEASIEQHSASKRFRGLPSPGAAGAVASLVLLHQHLLSNRYFDDVPAAFPRWASLGIPFVMLLCALGMVSSIPYVHFANRFFRVRKSFGYVVRLVVVLMLAIWWFQETLAVAFTTYALSGPALIAWRWIQRRLDWPA
jgi:CDP-diacylglycerol--serine O-phosphatidyltransferase